MSKLISMNTGDFSVYLPIYFRIFSKNPAGKKHLPKIVAFTSCFLQVFHRDDSTTKRWHVTNSRAIYRCWKMTNCSTGFRWVTKDEDDETSWRMIPTFFGLLVVELLNQKTGPSGTFVNTDHQDACLNFVGRSISSLTSSNVQMDTEFTFWSCKIP